MGLKNDCIIYCDSVDVSDRDSSDVSAVIVILMMSVIGIVIRKMVGGWFIEEHTSDIVRDSEHLEHTQNLKYGPL